MTQSKAQSYTPSIIYAESSEDISRHKLALLDAGGRVLKASSPALGVGIGISMQGCQAGEHVSVQTDGVVYDWQGSPSSLTPGTRYYQDLDGDLTSTYDPDSILVGIAVDDTTLLLLLRSTGGGTPSSSLSDTTDILEVSVTPSQPLLWLPVPVPSPDYILDISILGCGSLLQGTDYVIKQSDPLTTQYDLIVYDTASLVSTTLLGFSSLLNSIRDGNRLKIRRRLVV